MNIQFTPTLIKQINSRIIQGDIKKIAEATGFNRMAVSDALKGDGITGRNRTILEFAYVLTEERYKKQQQAIESFKKTIA